jgi:hypothetical protein
MAIDQVQVDAGVLVVEQDQAFAAGSHRMTISRTRSPCGSASTASKDVQNPGRGIGRWIGGTAGPGAAAATRQRSTPSCATQADVWLLCHLVAEPPTTSPRRPISGSSPRSTFRGASGRTFVLAIARPCVDEIRRHAAPCSRSA